MSSRRFESSQLRPFSDEIELSTAVRVAELVRVISEEMNLDYPQWSHPNADDPESCQCTALRVYEALDHFIRERSADLQAAMAIARDRKQNRCGNCLRREQQAAIQVKDMGGGRLISEVKTGG